MVDRIFGGAMRRICSVSFASMILLGAAVSAAVAEEVESVKRLTRTMARNGQPFFSSDVPVDVAD